MRVILLCHGETTTPNATFPCDQPLSADGRALAAKLVLPTVDIALRAPSTQCAETATALGVEARVETALRGCDYGMWRGKQLEEVLFTDRNGLNRWLTDPTASPHGGESMSSVVKRASTWLEGLPRCLPKLTDTDGAPGGRREDPALLVIADATFIKAAIVHAIGAPPHSCWRIDIGPLEPATLTGQTGRWHLSVGRRAE